MKINCAGPGIACDQQEDHAFDRFGLRKYLQGVFSTRDTPLSTSANPLVCYGVR